MTEPNHWERAALPRIVEHLHHYLRADQLPDLSDASLDRAIGEHDLDMTLVAAKRLRDAGLLTMDEIVSFRGKRM